ncbi:MAG: alpha/beta hydrolase [Myxococcota bacterium]
MTATRWGLAALLVLAIAGVAIVALLFRLQRAVLFPAPGARGPEPDLAAYGAERVWLELGSGRSETWLLAGHGGREPSAGREARGGPLLVFAHGNGERIDDWLDAFETPRAWGAAVLLVEYPGYGRSAGVPSQASVRAAMIAAYDWALTRPGVDAARVVGWGRSLGGGAVCALARERALAGLVLESTFTSVRSMAQRLGLPAFLVRDPFDNLEALGSYSGPVLIVHGEHDEMIPVEHARTLHAALPGSRLLLEPGCGHNDCPRPWNALREFLLETRLLTP